MARFQSVELVSLNGSLGESGLVRVLVPAATEPKELLGGFTEEELATSFDLVKDSKHWKNPIDARVIGIEGRAVEAIAYAIEFYTGSEATVMPFTERGVEVGYSFKAPGYYAGPCN